MPPTRRGGPRDWPGTASTETSLPPAKAAGEAGPTARRPQWPCADRGTFLGARDWTACLATLSPSRAAPRPASRLRSSAAASPMPAPAGSSPSCPSSPAPPSQPLAVARLPPSSIVPIAQQSADLISLKLLTTSSSGGSRLCGQAHDSQTALPTSLHSQVKAPTTTTLALIPGSASCAHRPMQAAAHPGSNVYYCRHVSSPGSVLLPH